MKVNNRKYSPETTSLISEYSYDYYDPDIVNCVLYDGQDGEIQTVDQLDEKQSKILNCILLKKIDKTQRNLDDVLNSLIR